MVFLTKIRISALLLFIAIVLIAIASVEAKGRGRGGRSRGRSGGKSGGTWGGWGGWGRWGGKSGRKWGVRSAGRLALKSQSVSKSQWAEDTSQILEEVDLSGGDSYSDGSGSNGKLPSVLLIVVGLFTIVFLNAGNSSSVLSSSNFELLDEIQTPNAIQNRSEPEYDFDNRRYAVPHLPLLTRD